MNLLLITFLKRFVKNLSYNRVLFYGKIIILCPKSIMSFQISTIQHPQEQYLIDCKSKTRKSECEQYIISRGHNFIGEQLFLSIITYAVKES